MKVFEVVGLARTKLFALHEIQALCTRSQDCNAERKLKFLWV